MDVRVGLWRKLSTKKLMLLNCGVGEDSWESLGLQRDPSSPSYRRSVLGVLWKDWCWSWNSNSLVTWWEELTHWKRPWCWERLKAGKGDDRGWDGWIALPTPEVYSNSCPLSQWCYSTISSYLSQHQGLFQWVSSSSQVAKVLELQLKHHSFQRNPRVDLLQNALVGSSCSPRDPQESSPTPQFKSISFSVLSFLYSPTLTSHDHWKNHSFD